MPSASETAKLVSGGRANLVGAFVGLWANGILAAVTVLCLHALCNSKIRYTTFQRSFDIVYICLLFVCGTIGSLANVISNTRAFVGHQDFPGAPMLYLLESYSGPVSICGFAALVLATWLQDGYLFYRFLLIYGYNIYLSIIPALMFLGSVVCSGMLLGKLARPGATIWKSSSVDIARPYWILSIGLNILLTILIVFRLLQTRRMTQSLLGNQSGKIYTTVANMLIESAGFYSLVGLLYLIFYGLKLQPVQEIFMCLLGEVQCISPIMIIYRVAKGASWSSHSFRRTESTNPYVLSSVMVSAMVSGLSNPVYTASSTSDGSKPDGDSMSPILKSDTPTTV